MKDLVYLVVPAVGYLSAQALKYAISLRRNGAQWIDFIASGGMPSAHTATVMALSTAIWRGFGIDSPLFALTAVTSFIVMYDAAGVRRTTGEQTAAIRKLAQATKTQLGHIDNARGHTPAEVAVGALLGILVGLLMYALMV
jgi:acid phosphatase family membrane protein YuiD